MKRIAWIAGMIACGVVSGSVGCTRTGGGAPPGGAPAATSGGGGGGGGGAPNDPGTPPGPPFSSGLVLATVAEQTADSLSLYALDETTGSIGELAGSPSDVAAPAGANAAIAVDAARRRVFVASDLSNAIAVADVDAHGSATPVAGSPFATQASAPCALAVGAGGTTLYVGYAGGPAISEYAVDATSGALTALAGSPVTIGGGARGPGSIAIAGRVLVVACHDTSDIRTFAIASDGTLTATGSTTVEINHAIDTAVVGSRVYVSLCNCDGTAGAIDVFDVDQGTATIARIQGAPFQFLGLDGFPHIAASPSGAILAVSIREPPQIELFSLNSDGSVTPTGSQALHGGDGGPQTIAWSPDGGYLFVADDSTGASTAGIYVLKLAGGALSPSSPFRYDVAGGPVGLAVAAIQVSP